MAGTRIQNSFGSSCSAIEPQSDTPTSPEPRTRTSPPLSHTMPTIKLYYFDFAGRAEPCRIALHHAGVEFEDIRVPFAEWKDRKASMLGGAMPVLEIDGVQINQSLAISRWAAKQSSLYPDDPVVALTVDSIADTVDEALRNCPQGDDPEKKKKAREEYAAGKLKTYCDVLNTIAERSGGDKYIAGTDEPTMADLQIFYGLLDMIRAGQFDYVDAAYCDQWPTLKALEDKIRASPLLTAYNASREG